jgi:hypothetical protein
MINLIVGAVAMAVFLLLVEYTRRRKLALNWWQWILTILGTMYAVFVVEMIVGFFGRRRSPSGIGDGSDHGHYCRDLGGLAGPFRL